MHSGDVLPAKNNVVRQFILIGAFVVREMFVERCANLRDDPGDTACVVGIVEMAEDIPDLLIPEGGADFVVNPFVTKEGQLPVFEGDVDQHAVAGRGLLHIKAGEDLGGAMDGIDVPTPILDIYPNLAAGTLFRLTDGRNDYIFFGLGKNLFFRKVWNMQRKNLNVQN